MFNKTKKALFLVILFFSFIECINAQVKISAIEIEGNNKTKNYIILRELPYHVGDYIAKDSLDYYNTVAQQQLFNTSLFTEAIVAYNTNDSLNYTIKIQLKERWYFFPIPYFRWVDRNFSQWWQQEHRSLDRVNYGINLRASNFTGNNDKLTLGLISGYTQQALLRYQFPYLDKKLHYGIAFGVQYFTQKEINTSTAFDKQIFYKTENIMQKGNRSYVNFLYRPNLYERHTLQIGVGNNEISDTAFLIQPAFLPNYSKSFSYVDLSFSFSRVKFDYNAYPTNGAATEFSAYHRFSNKSDLTSIQFRKVLAKPFSAHDFFIVESNTSIKFLANHNYTDAKLMGYGNLQLNGLEYYVVDGNAGSVFKAEWHHALGSYTVKNIIFKKTLPEVKYRFWLKAFTNLGYVYADRPINNSKLSNTLLRTAGVGLYIIIIYDFVLKIDYSLNQLGDKGLYLHAGLNF
jgi:outer membrane protein assembly factor BamA